MNSVSKADLDQCFAELGIAPQQIRRLFVGNTMLITSGKHTLGDVDFLASGVHAMELSIMESGLKLFIQHDDAGNKSIYVYPFADIRHFHIKPNGYMAILMR